MKFLDFKKLEFLKFSINAAGGGGNLKELEALANEAMSKKWKVPLKELIEFNDNDYIVGFGRLGKPVNKKIKGVEKIVFKGITELMRNEKVKDFPKAIFPLEAVAAQFARLFKAVSMMRENNLKIVIADCDWCGTRAVPSISLAVNSGKIAKDFSFCAIEKIEKGVKIFKEKDSYKLENAMRKEAAESKENGIFITGPLIKVKDAKIFLAQNAVDNSIKRGEILKTAGKIGKELFEGKIIDIKHDKVPGFCQLKILFKTESGKEYYIVARNEYIIVFDNKQKILSRAPDIINLIDKNNLPIQSLFLKKGLKLKAIKMPPNFLIDFPRKRSIWQKEWKEYFRKEKIKGLWDYPLP